MITWKTHFRIKALFFGWSKEKGDGRVFHTVSFVMIMRHGTIYLLIVILLGAYGVGFQIITISLLV